MIEIDRLAKAIRTEFPNLAESSDEVWAAAPPIKVIDCVLSLNRNYDKMVWPRVKRFAENHPEIQDLVGLRRLIKKHVSPFDFSSRELQYKDSRRSETLLSVLDYLIGVQQEHEGVYEADRLTSWALWARPGDYLSIGISGFGLAGFQYLRMLFGAPTTKPDVHIVRFVSKSIGRDVTPIQALYLMEKVAKQCDVPVQRLDSAVWASGARRKLLSGNPSVNE